MKQPDRELDAAAAAPALRALPAVHRVLAALGDDASPRPVVVDVVQRELAAARRRVLAGGAAPTGADVVAAARATLRTLRARRIRGVINATGVVIHTNLGRAPLGEPALAALARAAAAYTNLEYDLDAGARGERAASLEQSLAILCGAERATVVNNCAAALVLTLRHFAARPPRTRVVISRGELVQIGGGFRVPEILEASGARLREVGTTNKTSADDYRRAIDPRTAMVLRVHRSNFYVGGFVSEPTIAELAAVARDAGVPLVADLGSGATFDTSALGADGREPTPLQALADGADLVCFSGDKLLGGPQAGVIAGSAAHVEALKREPFFRALRCDKLVLAALEATVDSLLNGRADEVPIRQMINLPVEALRQRAQGIVAALSARGVRATVADGVGRVGGGSLPRAELQSVTVDVTGPDPQALAARLREGEPPVVGYVANGALRLDVRTVFPRQDQTLIEAVVAATRKTTAAAARVTAQEQS